MNAPQFRKAERRKARLRLGIVGPAGSGKSFGALMLAKGLGGRTAVIDTEAGSGDLYATTFDYDIMQITAPFTPEKYLAAIKAAEAAGYDTIVLDSISHLWSGDGGLLDMQGKMADKEKNSYTAWRHITPLHNQFIDAMLQSSCHVIATMRAKTEYVLETNEKGKQVPRKVGMAPVQRDGMDYEFTVVLDIDHDHDAKASKDRTQLFPATRYMKITEATGKELLEWLNSGKDTILCEHCSKAGKRVMVTEADAEASKAETGGKVFCAASLAAWRKAQKPQDGAGAGGGTQTSTQAPTAPPAQDHGQPAPVAATTTGEATRPKNKVEIMSEYRQAFAECKTEDDVRNILGMSNLDKEIASSAMLQGAIAGLAKDRLSEMTPAKEINTDVTQCPDCNGSGKLPDGADCAKCNGVGVI